jgi:hypothetical protein
MADGTTRPIKDIKVGDQVVATDPVLGITLAEPVTQLHDNLDTDLTDLTIAAPAGTAVVHTTTRHPFWDETTKAWTDAGALHAGDQLLAADGSLVTVVAVRTWSGHHDMRNLTVNEIHTYYVIVGSTPVLVHNCSAKLSRNLKKNGESPDKDVLDPEAHHIVPENDPLAAQARAVLAKHGVGIDDSENGVWLGHNAHRGTFKKDYVREINDDIVNADKAGGKNAVLNVLRETKQNLQDLDVHYGRKFF